MQLSTCSESGNTPLPVRYSALTQDEIISTCELAKRLNVTERTVFELRGKRLIPVIKFNGRNFRYNWSHVLAALEKLEVKTA